MVIGKAALRLVELKRRHAEIKDDTVHSRNLKCIENGRKVDEIISDEILTARLARKTLLGSGDGVIVLIDADQPALIGQTPGDLLRMSAAAQRAVDVTAVGLHV